MKPTFRGRMSHNSITLQTVGVSYFANCWKHSAVRSCVMKAAAPGILGLNGVGEYTEWPGGVKP
ncbi:MAG: hypothetical protein AB7Q45_24005, partial [Planctomycetaceae bacterium]